jgi:hypothetical protein
VREHLEPVRPCWPLRITGRYPRVPWQFDRPVSTPGHARADVIQGVTGVADVPAYTMILAVPTVVPQTAANFTAPAPGAPAEGEITAIPISPLANVNTELVPKDAEPVTRVGTTPVGLPSTTDATFIADRRRHYQHY